MNDLDTLFDNNIRWAEEIKAEDPHFFEKLAAQQTPEYLWIGCSDSRVPANEIVGLLPGELFVHRNIANTVVHTDLNCLSVIYYAVAVLKVKHVIVCGHYGCGGVQAAMGDQQVGLVDHWLRNIRDVYFNKQNAFGEDLSEKERVNLLCELNVAQQVANVTHLPAIQNAWEEGQELSVHGWIYDINDGLLKSLTPSIDNIEQVAEQYRVKRKLL
ncbi:carbonate dehydratase [Marinagarivorans cellulosilyticus]|uniref:Carbonic anhydrase 2 n=1 Tax=Marinagarivorans cellulosilyticus TaxID=2721545 RepID=A0AAN2BKH6_9GAMM|nr:carbonate dehydratase [Marinagarivorans cellulosilyticus]BCD97980.1 carbonic anhydrase [Marinagarivorans cellulosilyticus]